jgi:hypothetical protein
MENLIKKAAEKINLHCKRKCTNEQKLIINNKNYISIPVSSNNFYSIERKMSKKRFAFLDGGNQNIFSEPNVSVDVIRIYFCIFEEDKKIKSKKYDFLTVTTSEENEKNEIVYKSEIICENELKNKIDFCSALLFDPKDETLKNGFFDAKITEIASKIRRYLELFLAKEVIENHLERFETIILDGTLQQTIVNEKLFIDKLKKASEEKKVLVVLASKTTNVHTNSGMNYDELLNTNAKEIKMHRFVYYPGFIINSQSHDAEIYFAKLHEKSNIILRFELFKKDSANIDIIKLFSQIAFFAKDPVILGYPYGLVDADKFARITNQESEFLRTIFFARTNKLNKNIHNILDSISF